ncbi:YaaL family protein [Lactobacillaceae bacterium L1_55_11]|nr:YaaL family protein [Lactobacillaceae bacterium L1_55_11]
MFNNKKKPTNLKEEYDQRLLYQIERVKRDWDAARHSQVALVDSRVNGHWVEAQTALKRAKYGYLYREARHRHTRNSMHYYNGQID